MHGRVVDEGRRDGLARRCDLDPYVWWAMDAVRGLDLASAMEGRCWPLIAGRDVGVGEGWCWRTGRLAVAGRRRASGVVEGAACCNGGIWPWPDLGADGGLEDAVRGLDLAWS
ncbi:hypothetical protein ACLOJK_025720 [Asimina triloba]